ncbi:hypothetical protein [Methylocapsa acidiphila]|uniref:hypothetical protein n=1 Tax=Methylocapsa acidiphila TaxID=133552 RepID=UPI0012EC7011|nr:hypothetical protein [Methylocapsa acidiphila]
MATIATTNANEQDHLPLRVEKSTNQFGVEEIKITSVADLINISSFKVNRGNCELSEFAWVTPLCKTGDIPEIDKCATLENGLIGKPRTSIPLKFGRSWSLFFDNCNVIEVEIETDQGAELYSWSQ